MRMFSLPLGKAHPRPSYASNNGKQSANKTHPAKMMVPPVGCCIPSHPCRPEEEVAVCTMMVHSASAAVVHLCAPAAISATQRDMHPVMVVQLSPTMPRTAPAAISATQRHTHQVMVVPLSPTMPRTPAMAKQRDTHSTMAVPLALAAAA